MLTNIKLQFGYATYVMLLWRAFLLAHFGHPFWLIIYANKTENILQLLLHHNSFRLAFLTFMYC
jgi:hypothetical protein